LRAAAAAIAGLAIAIAIAAPAAAGPRPPLTHDGRWLTDARGRVVILHGLNMVNKTGSYTPEETGFGADDARFLRRHGFNTIRLGLIYAGLEPAPPGADATPRYEGGYLRSIARSERVLARRGIYSLLDFHQDLYNERFEGEGWPDWQTIDDGAPSEPKQGFPANYLVNAGLQRAFDNFWANTQVEGRGLQDAYAQAWRRVALKFRHNPNVLGYDLLNEPWPGSAFGPQGCANLQGCPTFDSTTLTEFTNRVLAAIRSVDPSTLVFYEPLVTFDFGADSAHGDTGDPNAGFSFHDYCLPGALGGPGSGPSCEPLEDMVFANADKQSEETGDVPLLTEFGATDDPETIERLVRLADAHMVGWQYWHYCGCDDPTTQGPGVQALVLDPSKPPRGANVKRDKLRLLARPFPRAVAGTPEQYGFDPASGEFTLAYSARSPDGTRLPRRRDTEVFVPRINYPHGYSAKATGAAVVSRAGSRVLRLERRRGAARVTLSVTRR
jgi:endoglycosylceramidase